MSFGRLILWQRDNVLSRVIIKIRTTNLVDIPHNPIMSEGDDIEGVSLTVQCEIIQQTMMGDLLMDEDIPSGGFVDDFIVPGFLSPNELLPPFHPPGPLNINISLALPDLNANPDEAMPEAHPWPVVDEVVPEAHGQPEVDDVAVQVENQEGEVQQDELDLQIQEAEEDPVQDLPVQGTGEDLDQLNGMPVPENAIANVDEP